MNKAKTKICVCGCTFRRPKGLRDLISSYKTIIPPEGVDLRFVLIDNDVNPSSQEQIETAAKDFPWPLQYVHEPDAGIPIARNRALTAAGRDGYVAFVDDDETVTPTWLTELYRVATETNATFVQGPVRMTVEKPEDRWWLDTIFFRQKEFADGASRHESWTNNVLIDLDFITRKKCRFENRLRYDGGTDTLFFRDIIACGGKGFYAADAWVQEVQPPGRLTWKWAINRQFRYGSTRAMTALLRRSRPQATLYCLARGTAIAGVGLAMMLTAVVKGKRGFADGIALLSRSAGILSGMVGHRTLEYARPAA
ncbi:succinoglycan biosynthesis protein ExoM [Loktanella ponticola]|uniref:Succinoglycan biosynthesis protein ExoM n=1 Tax=Yoonia ponticola TaxID=1524255 RepID=A0A7W9BIU1_9RHOB|nr:glycosyltransferase [Yoonia ponticola]MBB5721266.1 succinoglycan biosynthesis protein ExoM [Yoonia ponticola]